VWNKYLVMIVHVHNTIYYYLFNDIADFIHNKSCLQHKISYKQ